MSLPANTLSISRIPLDVLHEIFIAHINPHEGNWADIIEARKEIMAVCRLWRDNILHSRGLWRRVTLKRFMKPDFVSFCLKNKGVLGDMDLEIDGGVYTTVGIQTHREVKCMSLDDFMNKAIHLVRLHFPSIKSLQLEGDTEIDVIVRKLASFPPGKPNSLHYTSHSRLEVGSFDELPDFPGAAPTHLCFEGACPFWATTGPYIRLTVLDLRRVHKHLGVKWSQLRIVLETSHCLEDLSFDEVACKDWQEHPAIVLPRLPTFSLTYGDDSILGFLIKIVAPVMIGLRVRAHTDGTLATLVRVIPGMFGTASNISISGNFMAYEDQHMDEMLRQCRNVVTLDIADCPPSGTASLIRLVQTPGFEIRSLAVLKTSMEMSYIDSSRLIDGPFSPDMVIQGPVPGEDKKRDSQYYVEWAKKDGVIASSIIRTRL